MLACPTAAKSLAGAQTLHSSSRGSQKHACQASAFVNPCMLCLAQLKLTAAKQTCEAALPAWPTAEEGINGHGTLHTIFLSRRQHACKFSAFVKLPWLSWQGWHHAFATELRCYCCHAHCLDEAQNLQTTATTTEHYVCQTSAPGKLPCFPPTFMKSNRAKASSSPMMCPWLSLAGPETRYSILKAASLPSCSPNHASIDGLHICHRPTQLQKPLSQQSHPLKLPRWGCQKSGTFAMLS